MIRTEVGTLHPMTTAAGRKLLAGRTTDAIPKGATVVLTRDGDSERYTLHAVEPDLADLHDPSGLASFIAPEDVDAIEAQHAIAIADEATAPKPKRASRRKGAKR